MRKVSIDFEPGKPPKLSVAECTDVLDTIDEADFSKARAVYFGWMEPDGMMHTASFAESTMELAGMMHMHHTALIGNVLGLVSTTEYEGMDDDEEDDDA